MICCSRCRTLTPAGAFLLGFFRLADQQSDLALDVAPRIQLFQNLAGPAAKKFFVNLGDLARDHHLAIFTENLDHILNCFFYPVRGFVKDLGPRRSFDTLQHLPPLSALRRKKSAEAE